MSFIEGLIYGFGAIICFVISFRLAVRFFYNDYPKGRIDGEEIAISVVLAVFMGAGWFIFLPIWLIFIFCRHILVPILLPGDMVVKEKKKRKSWLRKDSNEL